MLSGHKDETMEMNTVKISIAEYYDLVAADVKLDILAAIMRDRLDETGYAQIDDICQTVFGIKYMGKEEASNDE